MFCCTYETYGQLVDPSRRMAEHDPRQDSPVVRSRLPMFRTMSRVPGGLMLIPLALGVLVNTLAPASPENRRLHHGAVHGRRPDAHRGAHPRHRRSDHRKPRRQGRRFHYHRGRPVRQDPGSHHLAVSCSASRSASTGCGASRSSRYAGHLRQQQRRVVAGVHRPVRRGARPRRLRRQRLRRRPVPGTLFLGASGLGDIPFIASSPQHSSRSSSASSSAPWTASGRRSWTPCRHHHPVHVRSRSAPASTCGPCSPAAFAGSSSADRRGHLHRRPDLSGYRFILRRGSMSGLGFAAGTTAGNAVAVPAVVAVADPSFEPFVASAAAQTATAVLVTALLAPTVAAWVLKRAGAISAEKVPDMSKASRSHPLTASTGANHARPSLGALHLLHRDRRRPTPRSRSHPGRRAVQRHLRHDPRRDRPHPRAPRRRGRRRTALGGRPSLPSRPSPPSRSRRPRSTSSSPWRTSAPTWPPSSPPSPATCSSWGPLRLPPARTWPCPRSFIADHPGPAFGSTAPANSSATTDGVVVGTIVKPNVGLDETSSGSWSATWRWPPSTSSRTTT